MIFMGKKIPPYLVGLLVIILLLALFVPLVLMPYLTNKPQMDQKHIEAQATLKLYETKRNSIDNYRGYVNDLQVKWDALETEMFVTAGNTANDLNRMFSDLGITPTSISVADEQEVMPAETSSTGDPLYSTNISLAFTAAPTKVLDVINFFEDTSDGSYYISNLNFSTVKQNQSDGKITAAAGDLNTTMTITLYYFKVGAVSAEAATEAPTAP